VEPTADDALARALAQDAAVPSEPLRRCVEEARAGAGLAGLLLARRLVAPEALARALTRVGPPGEPGSLRAGELVDGRFLVEGRIGAGGMGTVFRALDLARRGPVALKLLRGGDADPDRLLRFQREAELAARAGQAEGVVRVHALGRWRGLAYCAMELVDGRDLRAVLAAGLEPDRLADVVERLARTLAACHAIGVIHRDVKPANVLLADDGRVLLADFGLARHVDAERLTRTGEVLGTPAYMAPEQLAGRPRDVDERVDVYALGALLYRGLAGRPPFAAGKPLQLYRDILERDPPRPRTLAAGVPRDLEAICRRAMAKAPADRYPSAQALADDLARFRRGAAVVARPGRRLLRPLAAAGAAALLVGAVAAGLVATTAPGASEPGAPAADPRRAELAALAAADPLDAAQAGRALALLARAEGPRPAEAAGLRARARGRLVADALAKAAALQPPPGLRGDLARLAAEARADGVGAADLLRSEAVAEAWSTALHARAGDPDAQLFEQLSLQVGDATEAVGAPRPAAAPGPLRDALERVVADAVRTWATDGRDVERARVLLAQARVLHRDLGLPFPPSCRDGPLQALLDAKSLTDVSQAGRRERAAFARLLVDALRAGASPWTCHNIRSASCVTALVDALGPDGDGDAARFVRAFQASGEARAALLADLGTSRELAPRFRLEARAERLAALDVAGDPLAGPERAAVAAQVEALSERLGDLIVPRDVGTVCVWRLRLLEASAPEEAVAAVDAGLAALAARPDPAPPDDVDGVVRQADAASTRLERDATRRRLTAARGLVAGARGDDEALAAAEAAILAGDYLGAAGDRDALLRVLRRRERWAELARVSDGLRAAGEDSLVVLWEAVHARVVQDGLPAGLALARAGAAERADEGVAGPLVDALAAAARDDAAARDAALARLRRLVASVPELRELADALEAILAAAAPDPDR